MADPEDKPAVPGEHDARREEGVVDALNGDDVPQLDSPDVEGDAAPLELQDNNALAQGHQRLGAQLDGSELGSIDAESVDALPRRVGSPLDSNLSGPDDTPSVQVPQARIPLHSW
jgi:hypothetical protein